ncbi:hypothetical protein ABW20_dc0103597 [Dactylellina cionopaga]|nr:hypothetical protein ABW20_dc0103597 [Dactylellina cionopaga]
MAAIHAGPVNAEPIPLFQQPPPPPQEPTVQEQNVNQGPPRPQVEEQKMIITGVEVLSAALTVLYFVIVEVLKIKCRRERWWGLEPCYDCRPFLE